MMIDRIPEFEFADRKGTSDVFTGTVGTSFSAVPSSPGAEIQSFLVVNDSDNDVTETIKISIDGGTTTMDEIWPGGETSHTIKGAITQIHIKGASASVKYYVVLDREPA